MERRQKGEGREKKGWEEPVLPIKNRSCAPAEDLSVPAMFLLLALSWTSQHSTYNKTPIDLLIFLADLNENGQRWAADTYSLK